MRAAGLPVELDVHGETGELPRALDISAYRILQEALTNVLRHAHAATRRLENTRESVNSRVQQQQHRRHHTAEPKASAARPDRNARATPMFAGTLAAGQIDDGYERARAVPAHGRQ